MNTPKFSKLIAVCAGLSLVVLAQSSLAQETPDQPDDSATPAIPGRPIILPPKANPPDPKPPKRELSPPAPHAVQELVRDFQAAREAYLKTQQDLRRQLRDATEEQRAAIREQLKENLTLWLEAQRARMLDLREQAKQMKDKISELKPVIDSAQQEGRRR